MGEPRAPLDVKLIAGFIARDPAIIAEALAKLQRSFGPLDYQSPFTDFTHTAYYAAEFGSPLKRQFVSFARLIPPERLVEIKLRTNRLESRLSVGAKRQINIDPGYCSLSKLVLATTKDYAHRLYLDRGIYGEVTLLFKGDSFTSHDFTYPDFRTTEYIAYFNQIRALYKQQLAAHTP